MHFNTSEAMLFFDNALSNPCYTPNEIFQNMFNKIKLFPFLQFNDQKNKDYNH